MLDGLLTWLASPLSGALDHAIGARISWHGRLMVLAWGVAVPLAILLARYFKVVPRQDWPRELDNKFWWHSHRALNYGAVILGCVAVALVWQGDRYAGTARNLHGWLGWSIFSLGLLQVLGGHLRGTKGGPSAPRLGTDGTVLDLCGDHYDMTPRRVAFERVHKALGYTMLMLVWITVLLGLWVVDAPRWMWLGLAGWWVLLSAVVWYLQSERGCLDTYQAIWGPDPELPGAAVRPIGCGIRRVRSDASNAS
ncbi:cytochrome b561 domain-containing protein [Variovorax sp. Root411]|uniref:cytochrome b561 domain-containing protein n=1 Tax=Variovorax sp. Root411 TaxID=1736530 RepID=UPI0006F8EA3A|nr:cytochrome b561 domain-containing protein [Variovorax sp. Root411]KQW64925.1 cytochrome B [Variovorax sp. Root411]